MRELAVTDKRPQHVVASQPPHASLRTEISRLAAAFRSAGLDTPELDARLLVLAACSCSREDYLRDPEKRVTPDDAQRIEDCRARRIAREPVSRICGIREFWGHCFAIGPAVLDPRPDTETLVETALTIAARHGFGSGPARILDLGTGSGCILLSLLSELTEAWGVGVDIDPHAIETASDNAKRLGLAKRVSFLCADWCSALNGSFDLILANPPYIRRKDIDALDPEVRIYDPALALDGGDDGLRAYKDIVASGQSMLKPGGWILLEAGVGQADEIVQLFDSYGWLDADAKACVFRDLSGLNRVVAIKRQAQA